MTSPATSRQRLIVPGCPGPPLRSPTRSDDAPPRHLAPSPSQAALLLPGAPPRAPRQPLLVDELAAWDRGPVVPRLCRAEKHGGPIGAPADPLDEASLNTVGYVLDRYGRLSAADLVTLTHNQPPWRDANRGRVPRTSVPITVDAVREFFDQASDEDDEPEAVLDSATVTSFLSESLRDPHRPSQPSDLEHLRQLATTG